jgi:uncharacterized protein YndB with AHSA1/START domain
MPAWEIDLKFGGAWRSGWRNDENGREFGMHGEYREIDRPERIVHPEFFRDGESLVTSSITARGDTTTLIMTMRFLPARNATPRRKPAWPRAGP